jgi:hypothetical protein
MTIGSPGPLVPDLNGYVIGVVHSNGERATVQLASINNDESDSDDLAQLLVTLLDGHADLTVDNARKHWNTGADITP